MIKAFKSGKETFSEEIKQSLRRLYEAMYWLEEFEENISLTRDLVDKLKIRVPIAAALVVGIIYLASLFVPSRDYAYSVFIGLIVVGLYLGFLILFFTYNREKMSIAEETREYLNDLFNLKSAEEVYSYALRH